MSEVSRYIRCGGYRMQRLHLLYLGIYLLLSSLEGVVGRAADVLDSSRISVSSFG